MTFESKKVEILNKKFRSTPQKQIWPQTNEELKSMHAMFALYLNILCMNEN